jgi:hypothetical protein
MKRHYDFSKAERGKFYRKEALVRLPIYLDGQLQKRLERIAAEEGPGPRRRCELPLDQGRGAPGGTKVIDLGCQGPDLL